MPQPAPPFTPGSGAAIAYLNNLLRQRGVDVKAADAVFSREGLSGGIGDGGHAFGPGQFNDAGGVWTGRYPGMSAQQKNSLAWAPAGLQDLAAHVASVAGGLHGESAIRNIVSRFERPANPSGEIAGALGAYGLPTGGGTGFQLPAGGAPAVPPVPGLLQRPGGPPHPFGSSPIAAALRMLGFPTPGGIGP